MCLIISTRPRPAHAAGNLVGLFLSPLILQHYGWRALFHLFGLAGAPLLLLWAAVVPSQAGKAAEAAAGGRGDGSGSSVSVGQLLSKPATWAIIVANFGAPRRTAWADHVAGWATWQARPPACGLSPAAHACSLSSPKFAPVNHWGFFIYLSWMPTYFYRVLGALRSGWGCADAASLSLGGMPTELSLPCLLAFFDKHPPPWCCRPGPQGEQPYVVHPMGGHGAGIHHSRPGSRCACEVGPASAGSAARHAGGGVPGTRRRAGGAGQPRRVGACGPAGHDRCAGHDLAGYAVGLGGSCGVVRCWTAARGARSCRRTSCHPTCSPRTNPSRPGRVCRQHERHCAGRCGTLVRPVQHLWQPGGRRERIGCAAALRGSLCAGLQHCTRAGGGMRLHQLLAFCPTRPPALQSAALCWNGQAASRPCSWPPPPSTSWAQRCS